MRHATAETYTVVAVSKLTGKTRVVAARVGAFKASKVAAAIRAEGFTAEIRQTAHTKRIMALLD